jgi:hypothetical protein
MPQAKLTIGELEAGYPMYCKALRRLLQQGKTAQDIERTVCWGHLETLNRCLPTRYKSPSYLLALIRRDLEKPQETWNWLTQRFPIHHWANASFSSEKNS